jgi:hypothetical protein
MRTKKTTRPRKLRRERRWSWISSAGAAQAGLVQASSPHSVDQGEGGWVFDSRVSGYDRGDGASPDQLLDLLPIPSLVFRWRLSQRDHARAALSRCRS